MLAAIFRDSAATARVERCFALLTAVEDEVTEGSENQCFCGT
jgi:hypothetical protein